MSRGATVATTLRVLTSIRRDPRTVALLLGVPVLLMVLVRWIFDAQPSVFQRLAAPLLGVFPLVSMFLVSSITMLRERRSGTLERLMTMPVHRLDLIGGYAAGFGALALVQASLVTLVSAQWLGLELHGPVAGVLAIAVLNAVLGMALGLLVSAFARTEFQAVQFLPAVIFPQLLLCGLLGPREGMAAVLRWISDALPLSYAYDALVRISTGESLTQSLLVDLAVVMGSAILALVLGALTLRHLSG